MVGKSVILMPQSSFVIAGPTMRELTVAQQPYTTTQVSASAAASCTIIAVALLFCFGKKKKEGNHTEATAAVINDPGKEVELVEKTVPSVTEDTRDPDRYL